jgi:hypothetical protein
MTTLTPPVTLRSTTGTAPIRFERRDAQTVRITLADGSTQVYDVAELRTIVGMVTR